MSKYEQEPEAAVAHLMMDCDRMANPSNDWFSAELLRLIAKADTENRERIRYGFPDHVEAYERWYVASANVS